MQSKQLAGRKLTSGIKLLIAELTRVAIFASLNEIKAI